MGPTVLGLVILVFSTSYSHPQGSSYANEPSHSSRIQTHNNGINGAHTNPTYENIEINYRALAATNYRNFYRNRNYFSHNGDQPHHPHENIPPSDVDKISTVENMTDEKFTTKKVSQLMPVPTGRTMRTNEEFDRTATHMPDITSSSSSDDPILFSEPTQPMQYIRPVQTHTATSAALNAVTDANKGFRQKSKFLPNLDDPKCPKNAAYCEDLDKYPSQLLDEVLSKSYTPEKFQQVYGESTDNTSKVIDLKAILQRTGLNSGGPVEETPLCSSVEHTIYPRVAKNKEDKWMYIVNHAEYVQGVRVEKCLDEGQSCFFGEAVPAGYQTACRQKYIYKKLLALTEEGKTSTDTFKLPSCCVCYVKPVSITDRLAAILPTVKMGVDEFTSLAPKTTPISSHRTTTSAEDQDGIEFQSDQGVQNSTLTTTNVNEF